MRHLLVCLSVLPDERREALRRSAAFVLALAFAAGAAGCASAPVEEPAAVEAATALPAAALPIAPSAAAGDVVVIAVVDDGFNPYLHDFLASLMPLELPLADDPRAWLPGLDASAFASFEAMPLSLSADPDADAQALVERDAERWGAFPRSTAEEVHVRYVPGTKIVGMVDFAGDGFARGTDGHGARTSGVAAGNLHGTCPECLVVLVQNDGSEAASQWVQSQPWIDVVTNSWAASDAHRTFVYSGADVGMQRAASERGQTIFWSASNGVDGGGVAPIATYASSQMGPDWIMTVAGASPSGGTWSGTGKPADLAALSEAVPAPGGQTLAGTEDFDGASAGTPLAAGTYARALWHARAALAGASRVQAEGVVAKGEPYACGEARTDCELADGVLTAREMRSRFLLGLAHTPAGMKLGPSPPGPPVSEMELAAEGHGTLFGRALDDDAWAAEVARIVDPLTGASSALERPEGEAEWFVVDSYCRQSRWGAWEDGDHQGELPPPDPRFPVRQALAATCTVPDP